MRTPLAQCSLALAALLPSLQPVAAQGVQTATTAFVGVSVVSMDEDRIRRDWTVVVERGRISRMGPTASVVPPAGAALIDAKGGYLIPGLADMHVHFSADSAVNEALLRLYLVNGVTQVFNLHGAPLHLRMRERIAQGRLAGPDVFTAGPIVNDSSLTFEGGRRLVADYRAAGYDAVKVYNRLSREGFRGIALAARSGGLPVVGHVVRGLDSAGHARCDPSGVICHCPGCLDTTLASGQIGIVHIEEVMYTELNHHPTKNPRDRLALEAEIGPAARRIAAAGVWVTPTLEAYRSITAQISDLEAALGDPDIRYVPVAGRARWGPAENSYLKRYQPSDGPAFQAAYGLQELMVRAFRDAGVRLMAGTDVGLPTIVAGFSLHRDLQDMVKAGLTPYQALAAATVNPGEFATAVLGAKGERGTIAVGGRANLVVLDANPLAEIGHTTRIRGVMVRGRWYDRNELDRMLADLAAANGSSAPAGARR